MNVLALRRWLPGNYTRFVRVSKRTLTGLAVLLLIAIIYQAWSSNESGARIVFSGVQKGENGQTQMLNPRYQGTDKQSRPFTVSAATATQLNEDDVGLEKIDADMTLGNSSWLALTANLGVLKIKSKKLLLYNNINLFYEGGYEFRTSRAEIDLQQGTAVADSPIEGQGPAGTIRAKRFTALDRGKRLLFNDSVTVVLYP